MIGSTSGASGCEAIARLRSGGSAGVDRAALPLTHLDTFVEA
jgi:hypothetical protein